MNILDSEILNNDNINIFERLVRPISDFRLEYRLSDYNKNYNPNIGSNEAYKQFMLCCSSGVDHDFVVLCKTMDNKIFGLYVPRINYNIRRSDKLKPYIFSVDMNETIGNSPNCHLNNHIYFSFDKDLGDCGIITQLDDYEFWLFFMGNITGQVNTTIENIQNNNNIAYDIFGGTVNQDGNNVSFQLDYMEIEVYQLKHNINPIKTSIVTDDNKDIVDYLIPDYQLQLLQSRTRNEYYVNYNLTSGYMYNINILVMVKTVDNKVFGIYKSDNEAYFYSVDLNCRYTLTGIKTFVDTHTSNVIIKTNELYFELSGGEDGRIGCIVSNIFDDNIQNEIFGQLIYNRYNGYIEPTDDGIHMYNWYFLYSLRPNNMRLDYVNEFKWSQVDVYRILE